MKIDDAVYTFAAHHNLDRDIDIELLHAIMTGASYEEIGDMLHYEPSYVIQRVSRLCKKTKCKHRFGLMGAIYQMEKERKQ